MVRPVIGGKAGDYSRLGFEVVQQAAVNTSKTRSTSSSSSASTSLFRAVGPKNDVGSGRGLDVIWNSESEAERYFVKVVDRRRGATLFTSTAIPLDACRGSSCTLRIGDLASGAYTWMVRPVIGGNAGNYSKLEVVSHEVK